MPSCESRECGEPLELSILSETWLTGSDGIQEDRISAERSRAWIIDGATALLAELGLPGESDAGWYATELDRALRRATTANMGVKEALGAALDHIDQVANGLVGSELERFPSAAVLIVDATRSGTEVLTLADCHALIKTVDGTITHVGPEESNDQNVPVEMATARRRQRNTPAGVWVARRESAAVNPAGHLQLPPASRILLATDGAWRVLALRLVEDHAAFLSAFSAQSSADLLLQKVRDSDELHYGHWDDATAGVFRTPL